MGPKRDHISVKNLHFLVYILFYYIEGLKQWHDLYRNILGIRDHFSGGKVIVNLEHFWWGIPRQMVGINFYWPFYVGPLHNMAQRWHGFYIMVITAYNLSQMNKIGYL